MTNIIGPMKPTELGIFQHGKAEEAPEERQLIAGRRDDEADDDDRGGRG